MRFNNKLTKPSNEMSDEFKLYLLACSDALMGGRLESEKDNIVNLVKGVAPEYTARLAAYSRRELNNRAAGTLLTAALVRHHGGMWARLAVYNVVQRADEFGELIAAVDGLSRTRLRSDGVFKKPKLSLPSSLKRGLADVFESGRFDEYQYSKWNKRSAGVKIEDALRLVHPEPQNHKQTELFKKIANKQLEKAETHERKIGKIRTEVKDEKEKNELEKQTWRDLLQQKKLSHIALIRECKHILQTDSSLVGLYCEELWRTGESSNTLPHAYISMLREVLSGIFPVSLEQPVTATTQQLMRHRAGRVASKFGKRLVICIDTSLSMDCTLNSRSKISRLDSALTLGCSLLSTGEHRGIVFSEGAKFVPPISEDLFMGINATGNLVQRGMTNFFAATELIKRLDPDNFDAVLVLTDMAFNYELNNLEKKLARNVHGKSVYLVDLAGSLRSPIEFKNGCYFLAGLSEASLGLLDKLRQGNSMIDEIMKFNLLKPARKGE